MNISKYGLLLLFLLVGFGVAALSGSSSSPSSSIVECEVCEQVEVVKIYYYSWNYNAYNFNEDAIRSNLEESTNYCTISDQDSINKVFSSYYSYTPVSNSSSTNKAVTMVLDVIFIDGTIDTILIGPYFAITDSKADRYQNLDFVHKLLSVVPNTYSKLEH